MRVPYRTAIAATTRGFTLVEIAMALFIVSLVLGSILVPLATQIERRKVSDTQKALDEIKEALMGFAVANGYLPCPAIPAMPATNGLEDRNTTTFVCNRRQGFIPWATLGVSKLDGWGHIFRYSVTPAYASSAAPFTFTPILTGRDITVQTRIASGPSPLTIVGDIPAVVLSHGKNGYGSVDDQGTSQALPPGWPANNKDENINATTGLGTTFVSRVPQAAGLPGDSGEFDDIVVWVSPHILFNRMVAAGKLP